ncbi:hypothetical protein GGX14DRAFT_699262 [Mycena pura]|uniref:Uncharacterized protein n=1 Tax=Mycena pura TaxID=153505 RepID=A0AAD6V7Z5_9AGAR|nr:hypothetical protein GGX14DRAFT_699262 [Mycena pura]
MPRTQAASVDEPGARCGRAAAAARGGRSGGGGGARTDAARRAPRAGAAPRGSWLASHAIEWAMCARVTRGGAPRELGRVGAHRSAHSGGAACAGADASGALPTCDWAGGGGGCDGGYHDVGVSRICRCGHAHQPSRLAEISDPHRTKKVTRPETAKLYIVQCPEPVLELVFPLPPRSTPHATATAPPRSLLSRPSHIAMSSRTDNRNGLVAFPSFQKSLHSAPYATSMSDVALHPNMYAQHAKDSGDKLQESFKRAPQQGGPPLGCHPGGSPGGYPGDPGLMMRVPVTKIKMKRRECAATPAVPARIRPSAPSRYTTRRAAPPRARSPSSAPTLDFSLSVFYRDFVDLLPPPPPPPPHPPHPRRARPAGRSQNAPPPITYTRPTMYLISPRFPLAEPTLPVSTRTHIDIIIHPSIHIASILRLGFPAFGRFRLVSGFRACAPGFRYMFGTYSTHIYTTHTTRRAAAPSSRIVQSAAFNWGDIELEWERTRLPPGALAAAYTYSRICVRGRSPGTSPGTYSYSGYAPIRALACSAPGAAHQGRACPFLLPPCPSLLLIGCFPARHDGQARACLRSGHTCLSSGSTMRPLVIFIQIIPPPPDRAPINRSRHRRRDPAAPQTLDTANGGARQIDGHPTPAECRASNEQTINRSPPNFVRRTARWRDKIKLRCQRCQAIWGAFCCVAVDPFHPAQRARGPLRPHRLP